MDQFIPDPDGTRGFSYPSCFFNSGAAGKRKLKHWHGETRINGF